MNRSGFGILIPFSRSVVLSRIMRLVFVIAFASRCYISIAFHYAFAIICTSMACYTFNCTSVDSCSSFAKMFSSLVSLCTICASTKCCSSTLSSSYSSMHIKFTDVALDHVYFLAHQHHLLLHKNSTTNVPIVSMS